MSDLPEHLTTILEGNSEHQWGESALEMLFRKHKLKNAIYIIICLNTFSFSSEKHLLSAAFTE